MLIPLRKLSLGLGLLMTAASVHAQHLIWRPKDDQGSYTCLYGQIEVLATAPTTYYCGCNWWPSCPAGGYTGIQDLDGNRHVMIFSIWDSTKELHSVPYRQGDPRARLKRFGGEGEGAQTLLDYGWQLHKVYRYFIVKRQDEVGNTTLASAYFFDEGLGRWVYASTIQSPNTDKSVKGFGGMMNAFLENYGGQVKEAPRLATYRLWVGTAPDNLTSVTEAGGDGHWGVLNDSFFLASGDEAALGAIIDRERASDTAAIRGAGDRLHVNPQAIPSEELASLKQIFKGDQRPAH